ncbi:DUF4932 domain-containing protein [Oceanihabitans sp. IOP_32]|uniref:DUF4932 domain-containing protein n=1 Tax=Oceanihabitans sp. IOP_32 TaxID=2529032 RepID=UPI001292E8C6|nr:DUF4932 domain-containing protein [Oceanihabitans sp. IOP_32]QFZ54231.1 DUF4932 domain-containing protein [Oceanihabitans sp. IOP_32]
MKKSILLILFLVSIKSIGQKSELKITIDERIETLYSVAFLDNYFLIGKHDNLYKQKLVKQLQPLKQHKAVQLFDSLSKNHHFTYYRTVEWALQHSNFPEFRKINKNLGDNQTLLEEFREELIKFNQDSLFQHYWEVVKPINEQIISQIKKSETIDELPIYLEKYYGKKLSSYNLILSPLLHSGGFNSEITDQNGKKEVYALIGPNGEIDFVPYFDKNYMETDMILHEFGHSFVNPLVEKYDIEIERLKSKYFTQKLEENAKLQGYGEWKYVFNELLLRATTIQIAQKHFGKEKANKLLEYEKSIGFELVEKILEILREYETNRNKYVDFDKFYPILIERMK